MRNVMQKAQELADAVVASDVYNRMKDLEEEVANDEAAAAALNKMAVKRKIVEDVLTQKNMDREELKRVSRDMQLAEQEMNENEKIQALKAARKDFSTMMDNVNRILRLVITGEVQEEDTGLGGCSGSCDSCSGCS